MQSAPGRRLAAFALALALHLALFALMILSPRPSAAPAPRAVSVTLVSLPEPAPEPEIGPVTDRVVMEEGVETPLQEDEDRMERGVEDGSERRLESAPPAAAVSARSGAPEPAAGPAPEGADVYPLAPGTRSLLHALQCPGDPERFARTGVCPQQARAAANLAAPIGPQTLSEAGLGPIDVAGIRARFGVRTPDPGGVVTLSQRRHPGLGAADRESLPATRPDPAFGD